MSNYFPLFTKTNRAKPITIRATENEMPPCPFCDYPKLAKDHQIFRTFDESLLIRNLYPTIGDTIQTVFIETTDCDANFLMYSAETLCLVMRNFLDSYKFLSEQYPNKQIIGIKNAGPYSSGSIHHQHMQLVVLDHPLNPLNPDIFDGAPVWEEASIALNFSEKPATEQYEINLTIANKDLFTYGQSFERFCLLLQASIQFALTRITNTNSYNLAFYFEEERLHIKLLPRLFGNAFAHSPFLLAFDLHLVPDDLPTYRAELRAKFNEKLIDREEKKHGSD